MSSSHHLCLVPEFYWGKLDMPNSSKESHFSRKMNICRQTILSNSIFLSQEFLQDRKSSGVSPGGASRWPHAGSGRPSWSPRYRSPPSESAPEGYTQSTRPQSTFDLEKRSWLTAEKETPYLAELICHLLRHKCGAVLRVAPSQGEKRDISIRAVPKGSTESRSSRRDLKVLLIPCQVAPRTILSEVQLEEEDIWV